MIYKKQIFVEGYFDKLFLESLLHSLNLKDIEVKMPQMTGVSYGGKGNAISVFSSALNLLNDGSIENLALIVDADFTAISSQGFSNTLQAIKDKVEIKGFRLTKSSKNYETGLFFRNDSLKVDIAVWIMPNNGFDGYLEYLLFNALKITKSLIAADAIKISSALRNKEYPEHHEMKAELAIAMAMLENPGRNISHLIEKDILNYNNNPVLKNFTDFLKQFYK
jgi:hypothetical protein